jgi:hypothetical protein
MKIDKPSFFELFNTKFWTKLNESIVPFTDKPVDKNEFLDRLLSQVTDFTYTPSHPRHYIHINKHNGVTRFVPTFNRKDYCVYYLCIKLLEQEVAVNRVEGTFGGWTLGNPIRMKEEQEIIELDYVPFNTINELSWTQEWRSFQGIARKYNDSGAYGYYINLDIANFYDTVNLAILERKIRHAVPKTKQEVVTLLFHFLQNWNKKIEGYNIKTVGLPQDEIGDCSRILANFYLQDFDFAMKEICDKYNSKFIRFADDQIIFTHSKETARLILFEASKELFRINLNVNSSKVKEFKTKSEFEIYWAFEIFDFLRDTENQESINKGVELYFSLLDNGTRFKDNSVLKRLLTVNFKLIDPKYRHRLLSGFFDQDFLSGLTLWHFKRIRVAVDNDKEFFGQLDIMITSALFNSFLFNLRLFYSKERKDFDLKIIEDRIEEIKNASH